MDRRSVVLFPGLTPKCAWGAVAIIGMGALTLLTLPGGFRAVTRSIEGTQIPLSIPASPDDVAQAPPSDFALGDEGWDIDLRALVDGSYVGYTVWNLPTDDMADWTVGRSNAAASNVLGQDVEQCRGKPVFECFPQLQNEAGDRYGSLVTLARDSGHPVPVGITAMPIKGGKVRYFYNTITPVDRAHVVLNYHNIFDEQGEGIPEEYLVGITLTDSQVLRAQLRALASSLDQVQHSIDEAQAGGEAQTSDE